jgi:hypothetical protein
VHRSKTISSIFSSSGQNSLEAAGAFEFEPSSPPSRKISLKALSSSILSTDNASRSSNDYGDRPVVSEPSDASALPNDSSSSHSSSALDYPDLLPHQVDGIEALSRFESVNKPTSDKINPRFLSFYTPAEENRLDEPKVELLESSLSVSTEDSFEQPSVFPLEENALNPEYPLEVIEFFNLIASMTKASHAFFDNSDAYDSKSLEPFWPLLRKAIQSYLTLRHCSDFSSLPRSAAVDERVEKPTLEIHKQLLESLVSLLNSLTSLQQARKTGWFSWWSNAKTAKSIELLSQCMEKPIDVSKEEISSAPGSDINQYPPLLIEKNIIRYFQQLIRRAVIANKHQQILLSFFDILPIDIDNFYKKNQLSSTIMYHEFIKEPGVYLRSFIRLQQKQLLGDQRTQSLLDLLENQLVFVFGDELIEPIYSPNLFAQS